MCGVAQRTRYARNGDVNIAYQVVGDGPIDLVVVPGFVSNLDLGWIDPLHAAFLRRIASFSRLILHDKRGTGLADPVVGVPPLEQRMEDVHAVLDDVGSERAVLLGISEGGPMSLLFAATYPERTRALVLYGTFAKGRADEEHEGALRQGPLDHVIDAVKTTNAQ
jgi:pimeloyl-ACP methyl ester carboxylesterase